MSNKAKPTQRVQPKLRFPEFQDAGDWIKTDLHKIAKPVLEKAVGDVLEAALTLSGEHGLIAQGEYFGKKIAGENTDRYIKIIQDDFVYNDRTTKLSTYGTIKRLSKHKGGVVSPIYKCFRFNKDEYPLFWEWYFESGTHESQLRSLINEGARAGRFNISIQKFLSASAWRPKAEEQKKIADCLSSLDKLIEVEDQKLDTLQQYKKGLMKELFPAEGETLPKRRFPEFQNSPEWEEIEVGELFNLQDGYAFSSSDFVDFASDTVQVIRITDINNHNKNESKVYIPKSSIEDMKLTKFWVEQGDLLLSLTGAAGFNFFVWDSEPALINQRTMKITLKNRANAAMKILLSSLIYDKINVHGSGQNNNLSKESLKAIKLLMPKPDEQQRIADFISSIDDLIAAQSQKTNTLRDHKMGLMQQLFPAVSEVQE